MLELKTRLDPSSAICLLIGLSIRWRPRKGMKKVVHEKMFSLGNTLFVVVSGSKKYTKHLKNSPVCAIVVGKFAQLIKNSFVQWNLWESGFVELS